MESKRSVFYEDLKNDLRNPVFFVYYYWTSFKLWRWQRKARAWKL